MNSLRHDNRNVLYKNTGLNRRVKWHWDWIECGTATSYRLLLFWKLPPLALPRLLVFGTSEPAGTFTWNPYLEPRNLPEPLLGTSEPARTWRDDCPRVPQGLVWLGPQSFQLLGNKPCDSWRRKNTTLLTYQITRSLHRVIMASFSTTNITYSNSL